MPSTINMFSGLPPDIAQAQQQIALQQAIAQQLAARSSQGPDMSGWNSMRVVPKLSPFAAAGSAISPLVSAYAQSKLMKKQLALQQEIYNRGQTELGQALGGAAQNQAPPTPAAVMPTAGFAPSDSAPESAVGQSPASGTGFSTQAVTPAAPPPAAPTTYEERLYHALRAAQLGAIPESAVPLALKPYEPTELQRNDQYQNIAPELRRNLTLGEGFKKMMVDGTGGYIGAGPNGPQFNDVPGLSAAASSYAGGVERAKADQGFVKSMDNLGHVTEIPGYMARRAAEGGPANQAQDSRISPPTQQNGSGGPSAPPTKDDYFAGAPKFNYKNTIYMSDAEKKDASFAVDAKNDALKGSAAALQKTQKHSVDVANLADAFRTSYMGPGSDQKAAAAGIASAFGIASDNTTKRLAATEVADKLGIVFGTEASKAELGPGQRMTQTEWNVLLNRGAPNHKLLPYAAADVLTLRETQNQYEQKREEDRADYAMRPGADMRGFDRWYDKAHPQKEFVKQNAPRIQSEIYGRMGLKPDNPKTGATPPGVQKVINGVSYEKRADGNWYVANGGR